VFTQKLLFQGVLKVSDLSFVMGQPKGVIATKPKKENTKNTEKRTLESTLSYE
jgi:hypothetical protein